MKTVLFAMLIAGGALAVDGVLSRGHSANDGIKVTVRTGDGSTSLARAGVLDETPAERAIATARRTIEARPKDALAHVELAWALTRRARETADTSWYEHSDSAAVRALELDETNFEAQKVLVWNLLGRHEFVAARDAAKVLQERSLDDTLVYGFLVDAYVELGQYAEAEDAAQWMLNLRQGAPATLTRVGYLRELFGEVEGAIDVMWMAYHATRPGEIEDRAWILTQLSHLELQRGKLVDSERAVSAALDLFPDYHYALAQLAHLRRRQGRLDETVQLLHRRYEVAPHPENLYEYAVALADVGRTEEAGAAFSGFEAGALAESENVDNANVELIRYWIEHADPPQVERAVALAEARVAERADLRGRLALARALQAAGETEEAFEAATKAVEVGTVDPETRYFVGRLALELGDHPAASEHFDITCQMDPNSEVGRSAAEHLAVLVSDSAPAPAGE